MGRDSKKNRRNNNEQKKEELKEGKQRGRRARSRSPGKQSLLTTVNRMATRGGQRDLNNNATVKNKLSCNLCSENDVKSSKILPEAKGMQQSIKPDTPINVYTRFCLNTAKSKFSLVSPVADW